MTMSARPPGDPAGPRQLVFPTYEQTIAFHQALVARLGMGASGVSSEPKLRAALDRARQAAQSQRGDIVMLASFLLFGLVREKPFLKANAETGVALTLAFLLRNGGVVLAPDEEVAGVGLGVAEGGVYVGMVEQWLRDSLRRIR